MIYFFLTSAFASILVVAASIEPSQVSVSIPLDGRIVGGLITNIKNHPYLVSIRFEYFDDGAFYHHCGGSIISQRTVITASHCVYGKNPSQFIIVAATNTRQGRNGAMIPVEKIVMHEKFNSSNYNYDFALLILRAHLPINNFTIKPIKLADERPRAGVMATVTGWGSIKEGGDVSEDLREVYVPILTIKECREDYSEYEIPITDVMICAGFRGTGGKDACQGDSGGPLVADGKLAGVISWGYGCAQNNFPGVYASVADIREWIAENKS